MPILVWGHSEGALVARYVSEGVASVLHTGNSCSGLTLVPRDIPYLVLLGAKEPWKPKATEKFVKEHCDSELRWPEWDFVYLKGVGHFPPIANTAVRQAVDKFIARSLELHGR